MHKRALCLAVRDELKTAHAAQGWTALTQRECEVMFDGRPAPRCGERFFSVHRGPRSNDCRNTLDERFDVFITITLRPGRAPFDMIGPALLEKANTLDDWADQVRDIVHMNYNITATANATIQAAANAISPTPPATVYGFAEPLMYAGEGSPEQVGAAWFNATPDQDGFLGIALAMHFTGARCAQPLAIQQ